MNKKPAQHILRQNHQRVSGKNETKQDGGPGPDDVRQKAPSHAVPRSSNIQGLEMSFSRIQLPEESRWTRRQTCGAEKRTCGAVFLCWLMCWPVWCSFVETDLRGVMWTSAWEVGGRRDEWMKREMLAFFSLPWVHLASVVLRILVLRGLAGFRVGKRAFWIRPNLVLSDS